MNEVLPRAQAQKLKNEVLEKFKERIISRADIIDKRIKEEKALVTNNLRDFILTNQLEQKVK
jgi:hypothetical protein